MKKPKMILVKNFNIFFIISIVVISNLIDGFQFNKTPSEVRQQTDKLQTSSDDINLERTREAKLHVTLGNEKLDPGIVPTSLNENNVDLNGKEAADIDDLTDISGLSEKSKQELYAKEQVDSSKKIISQEETEKHSDSENIENYEKETENLNDSSTNLPVTNSHNKLKIINKNVTPQEKERKDNATPELVEPLREKLSLKSGGTQKIPEAAPELAELISEKPALKSEEIEPISESIPELIEPPTEQSFLKSEETAPIPESTPELVETINEKPALKSEEIQLISEPTPELVEPPKEQSFLKSEETAPIPESTPELVETKNEQPVLKLEETEPFPETRPELVEPPKEQQSLETKETKPIPEPTPEQAEPKNEQSALKPKEARPIPEATPDLVEPIKEQPVLISEETEIRPETTPKLAETKNEQKSHTFEKASETEFEKNQEAVQNIEDNSTNSELKVDELSQAPDLSKEAIIDAPKKELNLPSEANSELHKEDETLVKVLPYRDPKIQEETLQNVEDNSTNSEQKVEELYQAPDLSKESVLDESIKESQLTNEAQDQVKEEVPAHTDTNKDTVAPEHVEEVKLNSNLEDKNEKIEPVKFESTSEASDQYLNINPEDPMEKSTEASLPQSTTSDEATTTPELPIEDITHEQKLTTNEYNEPTPADQTEIIEDMNANQQESVTTAPSGYYYEQTSEDSETIEKTIENVQEVIEPVSGFNKIIRAKKNNTFPSKFCAELKPAKDFFNDNIEVYLSPIINILKKRRLEERLQPISALVMMALCLAGVWPLPILILLLNLIIVKVLIVFKKKRTILLTICIINRDLSKKVSEIRN